MAINGLLAGTGSAMLCMHDHNFAHLVTGGHSGESNDCHGANDCHSSDTASKQGHSHGDAATDSFEEAPHCIDVVIQSSDEPVRRIGELTQEKKPAVYTVQYEYSEPARKTGHTVEVRFASRAPPICGGSLEQCVRKTVLRI